MGQRIIHATGIDLDDLVHQLADTIPTGWRIVTISHTVGEDRATAVAVLEPDENR